MKLPPWALGSLIAAIPAGTYAWMLYTRPNVYEQIAEEIRKQEEAEKARTSKAALK